MNRELGCERHLLRVVVLVEIKMRGTLVAGDVGLFIEYHNLRSNQICSKCILVNRIQRFESYFKQFVVNKVLILYLNIL